MSVVNYRPGVVLDIGRAEANVAFELAIGTGRLSSDRTAVNYAGHYMYMGLNKGRDAFKHSTTREYLP